MWLFAAARGCSWLGVLDHGFLSCSWSFVVVLLVTLLFVAGYGCSCFFVVICDCLCGSWLFVTVRGCSCSSWLVDLSWLLVVVSGCSWLRVVVRGYAYLFVIAVGGGLGVVGVGASVLRGRNGVWYVIFGEGFCNTNMYVVSEKDMLFAHTCICSLKMNDRDSRQKRI